MLLWFAPDAVDAANYWLFCGSVSDHVYLRASTVGDGKLHVHVDNSADSDIEHRYDVAPYISDGIPCCVAIVFDGPASRLDFYADGTRLSPDYTTGTIPGAIGGTASNSMYLGRYYTSYADGIIIGASCYKRALCDNDIARLAANPYCWLGVQDLGWMYEAGGEVHALAADLSGAAALSGALGRLIGVGGALTGAAATAADAERLAGVAAALAASGAVDADLLKLMGMAADLSGVAVTEAQLIQLLQMASGLTGTASLSGTLKLLSELQRLVTPPIRQPCQSIRALRKLLNHSDSLLPMVSEGQVEQAGYLLATTAKQTYLRLDGKNDPLTAGLEVTGDVDASVDVNAGGDVNADGDVNAGTDVVATGNLEGAGLKVDGDTITGILTAAAALDFGSIAVDESADLTISLTGAVAGDVVMLGVPEGALSGGTGATDNVTFTAFVSAADTVTVRATNNDAASAVDLASGTFRATILKY